MNDFFLPSLTWFPFPVQHFILIHFQFVILPYKLGCCYMRASRLQSSKTDFHFLKITVEANSLSCTRLWHGLIAAFTLIHIYFHNMLNLYKSVYCDVYTWLFCLTCTLSLYVSGSPAL